MNATLLMVLILSLGAWRAWSRSPLFSAKVVIEIVAAVGVVVATMLGALLWIMNHGKSLAPQAAFTLALGLIFAATGLLVVIIILISDGPVPVPPPGAPPLRTRRDKLIPWLTDSALLTAASAIAAAVVPPAWTIVPAMIIDVVLFVAASVLTPLYMVARRADRGMAALMADSWVHWRYKPERWSAWVAARGASARRQRKLAAAPPEAYLGPAGMLLGPDYLPWKLSGAWLAAAAIRADPSGQCLVLTFSVYDGRTSSTKEHWVPLPDDGAPTLAALQDKLRASCPRAAIAIA